MTQKNLGISKSASWAGLFLVCAALPLMSGCNSVTSMIDKATVTVSPDLETVNVAVLFTNSVQSSYSGAFTIGDYGQLFVDPYTTTTPFEVGFSLNTSILNDQSYINIVPTDVMPNGVALPVGFPMAQINPLAPISSAFNLYGYVDVTHLEWLGAAAMFTITDKYFPSSLSLTDTVMSDSTGAPEIIVAAFGPTVNSAGAVTEPGGAALFANVKELSQDAQDGKLTPGQPLVIKPSLK